MLLKFKEIKESFASKLIKSAEALIPDLSNHILDLDIAIPITMYRYTLNHQGATVGWHYTQIKTWKQKDPFTRGLFLSGYWTGPSGIPTVIQSGKNAVELILRHEN